MRDRQTNAPYIPSAIIIMLAPRVGGARVGSAPTTRPLIIIAAIPLWARSIRCWKNKDWFVAGSRSLRGGDD